MTKKRRLAAAALCSMGVAGFVVDRVVHAEKLSPGLLLPVYLWPLWAFMCGVLTQRPGGLKGPLTQRNALTQRSGGGVLTQRSGGVLTQPPPGDDKTAALFEPASYPPGVSNCCQSLDFGGGDVAPALWAVADGAGGFVDQSANAHAITQSGTGAAATDISDYSLWGNATRHNSGKHHLVSGVAAPGNDDIVVRILRNASPGSDGAQVGWVSATASRFLTLSNKGSDVESGMYVRGASTTITPVTWTGPSGEWRDTWLVLKAGTGVRIFENGAAATAQIAAVPGSIDDGSFAIGGNIRDTTKCAVDVALVVIYRGASMLSSTDIGSVVATEYAKLTGQYLAKANGTRAATTLASRSGHAFLRKKTDDGTLWIPMGEDVPAIEHDSDGVLRYAPIAAQTAGPAYNGDLGNAAWVKRGSASVASDIGVDGRTCDCRITVGAASFNDIYTVTGIVSAATTVGAGICVKAKTGDTGTLCVYNAYGPSVANGWQIDLDALAKDVWHLITADHPAVTLRPSGGIIPNGGNAAPQFAALSGTVTCNIDYPTFIKDDTFVRPILTTTAARTTGAETPMAWSSSGNIPGGGTDIRISYDVHVGPFNSGRLGAVSDGSLTNRIDTYSFGTVIASYIAAAGGAPGNVTVDATSGRRLVVTECRATEASLSVDGDTDTGPYDAPTNCTVIFPLRDGAGARTGYGHALYTLRIEAL